MKKKHFKSELRILKKIIAHCDCACAGQWYFIKAHTCNIYLEHTVGTTFCGGSLSGVVVESCVP